jgi:hypothetical protein
MLLGDAKHAAAGHPTQLVFANANFAPGMNPFPTLTSDNRPLGSDSDPLIPSDAQQ